MKTNIKRMLFAAAVLLLAPLCAQAREINLPLNGTPIASVSPDGVPNEDRFVFSLDGLTRVTVVVDSERELYLLLNGGGYIRVISRQSEGYVYPLDLNPGDYGIAVCIIGDGIPFTISATAEKIDAPLDPEPNDDRASAVPMEFNTDYLGYKTVLDNDFYVFTLENDSELLLTRDMRTGIGTSLIKSDDSDVRGWTWLNEKEATVSLRAGTYYLNIWSIDTFSTGSYRVCARVTGPPAAKIKLECPNSMLAGNLADAHIFTVPEGYPIPDIVWTCSKPNVLKITPRGASCRIEAYNAGTVVLRAEVDGKTLKQRITVKSNGNSRSKPAYGKEKALYVSHKSMYYKNGFLCCETFLTNKTGVTIRRIEGMVGGVLNTFYQRFTAVANIGVWKPQKPLRPGQTAVIKFKTPQDGYVSFINLNKWKDDNWALVRADGIIVK